jgi:hypothetical protein
MCDHGELYQPTAKQRCDFLFAFASEWRLAEKKGQNYKEFMESMLKLSGMDKFSAIIKQDSLMWENKGIPCNDCMTKSLPPFLEPSLKEPDVGVELHSVSK